MRYLVDTNIVSELSKKQVSPEVQAWFGARTADELWLSAISVGEITYGIARLDEGRRKRRIDQWFKRELLEWFNGRICVLDQATMLIWAQIRAQGRTLPVVDSLIAASAIAQDAVLVTRNTADFDGIANLEVVNPFAAQAN